MTTVQNVHRENEKYGFTLQQGRQPKSSARKIAVLKRISGRIDMLLLSDLQEHTQFIPNVGDQIADGLNALVSSGVLLEEPSIMVIHHTDGAMLTSSNRNGIKHLPADSNKVDSFHGSDLEQSIRDDISFLRTSKHILENTEITGIIYDGRTQTLSLVTSVPS